MVSRMVKINLQKLCQMMSSNEIVTLINALGTGSKDLNIENLRYDKIVIMTDAYWWFSYRTLY